VVIAAAKLGMQAVIVNPPRVYGPGSSKNGTNPVNKLVAQFLKKSFYIYAHQKKAVNILRIYLHRRALLPPLPNLEMLFPYREPAHVKLPAGKTHRA